MRFRFCLVLAAALLLLSAAATHAQEEHEVFRGPDGTLLNTPIPSTEAQASVEGPARLRIYFDIVSHDRARHVEAMEPFEFVLVAVGATGGVNGWEAKLLLDERIKVIEREVDGVNVIGGDEYFVGLGRDCKIGQEVILARYKGMILEKGFTDLILGVGHRTDTSFDPPSPGYLSCMGPTDLHSFEAAEISAVINPERVELPQEDTGKPDLPFQMKRSRD